MSKIVKGEGNRAGLHAKIAEPPPIFCKDTKTRPIMDGFRKNNVNYWVFREIRSIIPHL